MLRCKGCSKDIPMNAVQQGGFHLGCAEEEVTVYKMQLEGQGQSIIFTEKEVEVIPQYLITDLHDGDFFKITRTRMKRAELDNISEFQGW